MPTLYHGTLIHSLSLTQLEVLPNALLCVSDTDGIIEWLERGVEGSEIQEVAARKGVILDGGVEVVVLGKGEVLCPGMIDTHTHAPQYPNNGLGQQYQLLEWLDKLTFPREAMFADVEYARRIYDQVVKRNLNAGTTTACYYGSLHDESTRVLADICDDKGQRAFVGKCCMDRNCPPTYTETTESCISSTKSWLSHFDKFTSPSSSDSGSGSDQSVPSPPLVQPILTPRFAISTTPEVLAFIGKLAHSRSPSIAIQTHLSENPAEVEFTKQLFPDCETYAGVYDKYDLLGPGTILAHCVHLDDKEREVISKRGAGISHCPTSNTHLNSGAADVGKMLRAGIKVGLGTDCGGGYALGILPSLRQAAGVSRFVSWSSAGSTASPSSCDAQPLSLPQLFHMATLGGASLCRLESRIGNFLPGKEFDALRIKPASPGMWTDDRDSPEEVFEKWLFTGDDRDVADVWVRGRRVGGAA
ncbi:hypothetical protein EHS25_001377 [Saitozyma podzolica]|uniref:Guanine deaminase n=1 Tax=Saitozyma podzolica TaxID=1890683 RepID=A0A427YGH0_9TREE|nr:hypothetical protein EHS25_001377 [Saitozyma podzolica]